MYFSFRTDILECGYLIILINNFRWNFMFDYFLKNSFFSHFYYLLDYKQSDGGNCCNWAVFCKTAWIKSIILIVLWQNQFFMVNPAGACVIVHHFDSFEGRYRDLFGNDYFCQLNCRRLIGMFFICRRSRFSSVISDSDNAIQPVAEHPIMKNSCCLLMKELPYPCLWIRQFSY